MKITPCKKCGADMIFVRLESGKLNPLSVASKEKRYVLVPRRAKKDGELPFKSSAEAILIDTYVSHFSDCPDAASFRKTPERPEPPPPGEDIKSS